MSREPRWITKQALLVLHDRSIALHGGAPGLRDAGLLESALARPVNRYHYEGVDEPHALAATYLIGFASNHPFVDGNKRTAFLAGGVFLRMNGWKLTATQADAAQRVLAIAAGERDIDQAAAWLRDKSERL